MKVFLVHSYRGHGKDSFCLNPEKFEVISSRDGDGILSFSKIKKYAFADAVKEEVFPFLFPGKEVSSISRKEKEEKRNEIKIYAEEKKEKDVYHWVKIVVEKILSSGGEEEVIISDWRFPCEREYLLSLGWEVKSVRVISLRAPIPPEKEEHYLDEVEDDIVVRWKE